MKRVNWVGKETIAIISEMGVSCYVQFKDDIRQQGRKYYQAVIDKDINGVPGGCDENLSGRCCSEISKSSWKKIKKNIRDLIHSKYKKEHKYQLKENDRVKLTVKSCIKIDNFKMESLENFNHYMLEPKALDKKEVFKRLVGALQKQKIAQEHYKNKNSWAEYNHDDVALDLSNKIISGAITEQDNNFIKEKEEREK